MRKVWIGPILWLVVYTVALLGLLFPARAIDYSAFEVAQNRRISYESFYEAERDGAGNTYAWTRPVANLYFIDVPRYAPLYFHIRLNLNRPQDAPPAELEFNEIRGEKHLPLGTIRYQPNQPVFQNYDFEIPACLQCQNGTLVEIKTNWFRPGGDKRALGVVVAEYGVRLGVGHLRSLVWPQPYLIVALLFGVGLALWFGQLGLSWWAGTLLMLPVAFYLAVFQLYLLDDCTWLTVYALGLIATACGWRWDSNSRKWWLLAGTGFFLAFLCVSPQSITDVKLFLGWISDLGRNPTGPYDIYRHSPRLDYLPLITYILWPYGVITNWFGASQSVAVLKVFYAVPIGLTVWLIWSYVNQTGAFKRFASPKIKWDGQTQTFALLAFGLTMAFDPAVWGQTDAIMCLMLAATLISLNQRWVWASGILLGLDVIFKPQAWFVAPYFAWLLLLRCGWWRGFWAGVVGAVVALSLSVLAFGFDPQSVADFWNQPSLGGNLGKGSSFAFNVVYLLGYGDTEPPNWVVYGGFTIIGITIGLVIWQSWQRRNQSVERQDELAHDAVASALLVAVVFLFAIKMRERYLDYALLFLAIAALRNRKYILPYTVWNVTCLINMTAIYLGDRKEKVPNTFFVWREIMAAPSMPYIVAAVSLTVFGWISIMFVLPEQPKPLDTPVEEQVLAEQLG